MTDKDKDLESGRGTTDRTGSLEQAFAEAVRHFQQDRLEESESVVSEIRRLHPDRPDVLHLSALVALKTERPADAIGYLDKAVAAQPDSAELFNLLGGPWALVTGAESKIGGGALPVGPDVA